MEDKFDIKQYIKYNFKNKSAQITEDLRGDKFAHCKSIEKDIFDDVNSEIKPKLDQMNVVGGLIEKDRCSLAVIGSRKITDYGRRVCDELVRDVAGAGVTIVSGLMYGVDFHAHKAALESGARTIAVLGYGLGHLKNNRYAYKLAAEIINKDCGAIISEYEHSQSANQWTFPKRNRIIAGLADVILIVEADEGSGSMITAEFGLEMGKEVVSVPGSIFSNVSRGTNKLIKDGARLIDTANEILEYFGKATNEGSQISMSSNDLEKLIELSKRLNAKEKKILIAIVRSGQSITKDKISEITKIDIIDINPILTKLEMDQTIKIDLKGKYVVARLR